MFSLRYITTVGQGTQGYTSLQSAKYNVHRGQSYNTSLNKDSRDLCAYSQSFSLSCLLTLLTVATFSAAFFSKWSNNSCKHDHQPHIASTSDKHIHLLKSFSVKTNPEAANQMLHYLLTSFSSFVLHDFFLKHVTSSHRPIPHRLLQKTNLCPSRCGMLSPALASCFCAKYS